MLKNTDQIALTISKNREELLWKSKFNIYLNINKHKFNMYLNINILVFFMSNYLNVFKLFTCL